MNNKKKSDRIFLCYASEDRNIVDIVYDSLKEEGFNSWMDKRNLLPGQNWDYEIRESIKNSSLILIFFSKNSVEKRGYVQREFKLALETLEEIPDGEIFIIPVRLDDCKIPNKFKFLHYIDFFEDNGFEKILNSIRIRFEKLGIIKPDINESTELNDIDTRQLELRYLGLKSLIESAEGYGFHNADLGHPVYRAGSKGRTDIATYADSPEKNSLFKELSKLSIELKNRGIENQHYIWWFDFSTWENFCKFAISIYEKKILKK